MTVFSVAFCKNLVRKEIDVATLHFVSFKTSIPSNKVDLLLNPSCWPAIKRVSIKPNENLTNNAVTPLSSNNSSNLKSDSKFFLIYYQNLRGQEQNLKIYMFHQLRVVMMLFVNQVHSDSKLVYVSNLEALEIVFVKIRFNVNLLICSLYVPHLTTAFERFMETTHCKIDDIILICWDFN